MDDAPTYTAFAGARQIASGPLADFLPRLHAWAAAHDELPLIFED